MTVKPRPSRRGPIVAIVALAILAAAAAGLWYLFLRPAGPAPVSIESAAPAPVAGASATPSADPAAGGGSAAESSAATSGVGSAGAGDAGAGEGIEGTWSVDGSIGSFDDFSGSFVGYRVRETLATIGATEAVGRTPDVTGSLTVEGTTITAAEFTADLTGLRSDDNRRDGQLRRQALETEQFPTASFVLTTPIELDGEPAEGATIAFAAVGDLTLHGVTRSVEIPLEARLADGVVTVAGSLPIAFADYGIDPPESMIVLSVEDSGTMELQLHLTRP